MQECFAADVDLLRTLVPTLKRRGIPVLPLLTYVVINKIYYGPTNPGLVYTKLLLLAEAKEVRVRVLLESMPRDRPSSFEAALFGVDTHDDPEITLLKMYIAELN